MNTGENTTEKQMLENKRVKYLPKMDLPVVLSEQKQTEYNNTSIINEDQSKPVILNVSYKINFIADVNTISKTFYMELNLILHWNDPAAVGQKQGLIQNAEAMGLLSPQLDILQSRAIKIESSTLQVINNKVGKVKASYHYTGNVSIDEMSLVDFPFDHQKLSIRFRSHRLDHTQLILKPSNPVTCVMDYFHIQEWNVLGHYISTSISDSSLSTVGKQYSVASIDILVERDYGWYVNNIYVTCALILLYGFLSFIIAVDSRQAKIDICNTVLVATIANKLVVSTEIPKLKHKTHVESFADACLFTQLGVYVSSFIVEYAYNRFGEESAYHTNYACATLLAMIFMYELGKLYLLFKRRKAYSSEWLKLAQSFHDQVHSINDAGTSEVSPPGKSRVDARPGIFRQASSRKVLSLD